MHRSTKDRESKPFHFISLVLLARSSSRASTVELGLLISRTLFQNSIRHCKYQHSPVNAYILITFKMAPSVLLDNFTEVASVKDFLVNSNAPKFDYDTKVKGETDVLSKQAEHKTSFGDWRDDFFTKGYSVVKGAIPRERAIQYQDRAMDWFSNSTSVLI